MVCAAGIDLLDSAVVCDDEIDQLADVVLWCRFSNEQPNVVEGVGSPGNENQETDENGTDRIDIPDDSATDNGHGKTESIDDDVVAMVDKEDMDGWVASEEEAIDAK